MIQIFQFLLLLFFLKRLCLIAPLLHRQKFSIIVLLVSIIPGILLHPVMPLLFLQVGRIKSLVLLYTIETFSTPGNVTQFLHNPLPHFLHRLLPHFYLRTGSGCYFLADSRNSSESLKYSSPSFTGLAAFFHAPVARTTKSYSFFSSSTL